MSPIELTCTGCGKKFMGYLTDISTCGSCKRGEASKEAERYKHVIKEMLDKLRVRDLWKK